MAKNLVIVESPAKAKTIEGFLGKDFLVKSSYGHIRDLPERNLSINIEKGFVPDYVVPSDKKKLVAELKGLAKKAETIWLATDEDREGEAISWHLQEALELDEKRVKRIVFHEITKNAILKAIENPRKVDYNLVDAQQARRILDRLVGYEISPILWKKVKPSLSAGRVQSVAVRLIVEREREINNFNSSSSFRITAEFFTHDKVLVKAELPHRFPKEQDAKKFLENCIGATFTVSDLEVKPATKQPSAPFTTSTLQQEASRKLGFSVSQTMAIAQKLYESGKITYMRTDSVNLSDFAMEAAKNEIVSYYGKEYANPRTYKTKSKGAQEAHEAIRPTYMNVHKIEGEAREAKLYELIWKRTIASQMSEAKLEKTTVSISISNQPEQFVAKGEVLKFDGFLKVYLESTDDENEENSESMLPPLKKGQQLLVEKIMATQRFTQHPPRYTEASLVKKLEELGIGRPSTYAPTISTVQKRGYVVKEDREGIARNYTVLTMQQNQIKEEAKTEITGREKAKLFPSDIGMVVTDFLIQNFKDIMDYGFTADVERQFDEVAEGAIKWNKMIEAFYNPFHAIVENTKETAERATGERVLGIDPQSGKNIIVRIGRFGPMVQVGSSEDEEKPKFASLRTGQSIENITLEEAIDLFKLPRKIGTYNNIDITAAIGKFGPYLKYGNMFVSIRSQDGDDPMTINLQRAIELIEAKKENIKNSVIKQFEENKEIQVLRGRYGAYIKAGRKNFKIPKDKIPEELTLEECIAIANIPEKKESSKTKENKTPSKVKAKAKKKIVKKAKTK
ncbi:MAG: type I DNA topoisomerase [Bacteroidetes bacterium]|nr:type I DNA topoisomerase [Bacteroidota bacterium]MBV6460487.1 DNA topoisomerase 1 [Flavobacteriales bacterium]WKZ74235.1 MAG: type I DNA topoisomerase [Vicingaceae bacterium]MCL4815901.1 type I DNA topoisomerase [Flavobacteriales bacterium]NOG94752.1 type I DNA topoisomerase [Bacteroidota bacterium]